MLNTMKKALRKLIEKTLREHTKVVLDSWPDQIADASMYSDYELVIFNIPKKLNEGLISTTPIHDAYNILSRVFKYREDPVVPIRKDVRNNRLYIEINTLPLNTIQFLLKTINNLGYFVSQIMVLGISYDKKKENYEQFRYSDPKINEILNEKDEYQEIWLNIEAKFDIDSETPKVLYHVTDKKHLNKILRIGLVPKSKSKKAYHPDRIYFVSDLRDARDLMDELYSLPNNKNEYLILKITGENLNIKSYQDPNFQGFGFYTLENIPPQFIVDVIE
jgi:hypothetical protein